MPFASHRPSGPVLRSTDILAVVEFSPYEQARVLLRCLTQMTLYCVTLYCKSQTTCKILVKMIWPGKEALRRRAGV
jgi:hypothetical protein